MIFGKAIEKFALENKEIIFRYPRLDDLEGLLKLINSLVEEKAMIMAQKKKTKKEEAKWLPDILNKIKNKEAMCLIVEVDGKIMGSADVRRGERAPENHVGELGISLRKEIRGKGIGKKLLKIIMEEAERVLKVKIIKLRVMGINKVAYNLYKKCGFQEAGRIKSGINYYGKYVDDITMVKYL